MKRILFGFVLGIVAGVIGVWYLETWLNGRSLVQTHNEVSRETVAIRASLQETFDNLTPEAIKKELAETSMVVREKAKVMGQAFMDATFNARTTATIKTKLVAESHLSGMRVNVDSAHGLVTLSGTLPNHELVAQAVKIALDTEGVTKVVSTIQVQPLETPHTPAQSASP